MNITRESTGDLTVELKVNITPEDYEEKVKKQLKDYQRKANIPGFRPGHIPFGMINKMYGKAITVEEINKVLSDSVTKYIEEQQLNLLGNPLPNHDKNSGIDFDHPGSFDFHFELGLIPEFKVDLDSLSAEYYIIRADDEMIDRYVENVRKRYGKPVEEEQAEPSAEEEETKKEQKTEPAELNEELFNKVYPSMDITTLNDFREQIRKDTESSFLGESDSLFFRSVSDKLIKETTFGLPDEFLKKWLLETNEKKLSAAAIEKDYAQFSESMRWELIENRILKDNGIEVKEEEIRNHIKNYFKKSLPLNSDDPETEKRYDTLVDSIMKNKEEVRKINNELYTTRLMELFKAKVSIENKEVSYPEFINIAATLYKHDHDHEHEHDHDHDHSHEEEQV